jgi:opacity protein-like surface antigen
MPCIRTRLLLCLFAFSVVGFTQEYPKAEVFAGYSYLNVDTNGLSPRQNANGWEAGLSGNFTRLFAAEFEGAGHYRTISGVAVHDYSYLAGPRLNIRPLFIHALIGGDHLNGSISGLSASQDSLAGAFGGGVQWKVSGNWSVRASTDYVFSRHNLLGGPSVTQNNFHAGAGIVYSFGGTKSAAR